MKYYAVITGASSGLGEEFAAQLAERGFNLLIIARRQERLESLAKKLREQYHVTVKVLSADLSRREECAFVLERTAELPVAVFINNAGFGDCGAFTETDLEKDLAMIDVNVTAVHYMAKGILRQFDAQGKGYLLNVASSAGLLPGGPYMATYYATKAYVASLTRAVARELDAAGSYVYVGALCPGPVDTEFNSVANVEFALSGISAHDCVSYALSKMFKRQVIIVPTFTMKAAVALGRYMPQSLAVAMTGRQQRKKMGPYRQP